MNHAQKRHATETLVVVRQREPLGYDNRLPASSIDGEYTGFARGMDHEVGNRGWPAGSRRCPDPYLVVETRATRAQRGQSLAAHALAAIFALADAYIATGILLWKPVPLTGADLVSSVF